MAVVKAIGLSPCARTRLRPISR